MTEATPQLRLIGGYEVLGELSSGGMGSVYLGRARRAHGFEKLVAIKTIRADLESTDRARLLFLDEARLVGQINHPGVAQVYDFGDEGGTLYLVMEYIEGASLSRIFAADLMPMEPAVACRLAAELCRALHAAHELRDKEGQPLDVVHRDVSPQNVILGFDGHVKVIDFGVALVRDRMTPRTRTGQITGKPAYMAPEQLEGEVVDRRSDLSAAAAVLHELLTGRKLFRRDSLAATIAAVLNSPVPVPSADNGSVSAWLDALVARGLMRDPAQRFQTAEEMADALDELVSSFSDASSLTAWAHKHLRDMRLAHNETVEELVSTSAGAGHGRENDVATMPGRATLANAAADTVPLPAPAPPPLSAPNKRSRAAVLATLGVISVVAIAGAVWYVRASRAAPAADSKPASIAETAAPSPATVVPEPDVTSVRPAVDAPKPANDDPLPPARAKRDRRRRKRKPQPAVETTAEAAVEKAPATYGMLSIDAQPYAHVRIDGRAGGNTPLLRKRMQTGAYRIELINPDDGTVRLEKTITVTEGGHARVVDTGR